METLTLKPHHFMDIIKLYGAGLDRFVPDEKLGHDFYRAGNLILADPAQPVRLTVEGDDICRPCRMYQGRCRDSIHHIPGMTAKDTWNRLLDSRIFSLFHLNPEPRTALELCAVFHEGHRHIFEIWREEEEAATEKRHALFTAGAEKYLTRWGREI